MSFDDKKNSLDTVENISDIWNNPFVKEFISVINELSYPLPLVKLVDKSVSKLLDIQIKNKQEQVIKELLISKSITEEDIKDVNFVIEFARLLSAVNRTRGNTKIQCMTKIFKGTICCVRKDYDLYEEYLTRVCDMSEREMNILYIMHQCEQQEAYTNYKDDDREQKLMRIWHEEKTRAKNEMGIDEANLRSIIVGMQRTGFCSIEYIHCAAGDVQVYILTKYFIDFIKCITN